MKKEIYMGLLKLLPDIKEQYSPSKNVRSDLYKTPRVAYILSFSENDGGLIVELAKRYGEDFLLCYTPQMANEIERIKNLVGKNLRLAEYSHKTLFLGMTFRLLKNTPVIITDNYFPELAALPKKILTPEKISEHNRDSSAFSENSRFMKLLKSKKKKSRSIIQIWHATGAIKCFGWMDPKTIQRSSADQNRFQQVYDTFTDIVVGSEAMAEVFKKSWLVPDKVIRRIGVPRTDQLGMKFLENKRYNCGQQTSNNVQKRILYAPTYRDNISESEQIFEKVFSAFSKQKADLHLLVKLHPYTRMQLEKVKDNFIVSFDNALLTEEPLNDLLESCDVFITDYSSSVFDFMLKRPNSPYLFFCPDLENYSHETGIQEEFLQDVDGRIAKNEDQLITLLKNIESSTFEETIKDSSSEIRNHWHSYNDGHAVQRLLDLVSARLL
ncbi:CDP-glycerol glycerophosphotransferase family protein [Enterococcus sp. AD013-P3]|uniref:CDP-glycerol glycerophosphotransferase family protein n=1 Tax=Enterococcus sp. AD013-P3 TaxID=3411036 RepID=UPI003B961A4B